MCTVHYQFCIPFPTIVFENWSFSFSLGFRKKFKYRNRYAAHRGNFTDLSYWWNRLCYFYDLGAFWREFRRDIWWGQEMALLFSSFTLLQAGWGHFTRNTCWQACGAARFLRFRLLFLRAAPFPGVAPTIFRFCTNLVCNPELSGVGADLSV